MKYNSGQKVRINKNGNLEHEMRRTAESFSLPFVATISHILPDPHLGIDMYIFKGGGWGWYESEIEGLYIEEIIDRFELLDFD